MNPLTEFPLTFNRYDGNDTVEIGDNIAGTVKVYGQGGDDKITGGYGASQIDKLWGGSGNDKIWMINKNQRAMDNVDDKNYGYGGLGNDKLYGSDAKDILWGDELDPMPYGVPTAMMPGMVD